MQMPERLPRLIINMACYVKPPTGISLFREKQYGRADIQKKEHRQSVVARAATERFKAQPGSVLLATGAAWEGFDFPGDCVSLLVIPRLPFAHPDALKEKEKEQYSSLRAFIRAVVVPEMQIKLKQGFGRAIRTETDTCVVAILDERASYGKRYHINVVGALPDMPLTTNRQEVEEFIRSVKSEGYFLKEAV